MRIKTYSALILAMLFLISCARHDSPREVLMKYFEASRKGDSAVAYSYISEKDRVVKSLEEYSSLSKEGGMMAKAFTSKLSYKINDVRIDGSKAEASVETTGPDVAAMMGEFMGKAFSMAFLDSKNKDAEMAKFLEDKGKSNSIPLRTEISKVFLLKEKE